jgi:energy-coupling factor transport system permease protein
MSLYLYLNKNTFVHRLNPITKILCLLLLFAAAMFFIHPLYLLMLAGLLLVIGISSRMLENLKKLWILMAMIGIFSFILWSIFYRGPTVVFKYRFLSVSQESLLYGLGMAVRLNIMLFSGLIFLSTTRIEDFTAGLNKIGVPFSASFALSLAFRLVPMFLGTASTIIEAQKSRGLDLDSGNILQRIKKHIPLLIPVFVSALRTVDNLSVALESKGFGAGSKRTYYLQYDFRTADYLALSFIVGLNVAILYLRLRGLGDI